MMRFYNVIFFWLLTVSSFSQGKLMLVGGGAEEEGGWSDEPYAWAVAQSANRKVAVISYADEDNFIPDYFISLGAAAATNFKIDTKGVADQQSTYDALMQYDVFFFKGGDQSIYYLNYKGTRTQQAVIDKFNAGGVITGTSAGMAILSGVVYTAEKGSVYPDEALQNYNNTNITLANDFFSFLPGLIVDSHFTERGRIGRMFGFLARWENDHDELLTGIGVDDRTALCFTTSNDATVFGTGSVTVCHAPSFLSNDGHKPASDSVFVLQALHHDVISFLPTPSIVLQDQQPVLTVGNPWSETGNYTVMLSGSENLGPNVSFIDAFVQTNTATDSVVVVTAPGKAKSFISQLNSKGVRTIVVETASATNSDEQWELRNEIRTSRKILFVENDDDKLFTFLDGGPTGALLAGHVKRNQMLVGFIGEDSRYAGKVFVTNHLSDIYAAYYGDLIYRDGLNLLKTSVVMSNTYEASTTAFYENTTAAIPYAMVQDHVKYGIYLNRNSYLKLYQLAGNNYYRSYGSFPAMILANKLTFAKVAERPVNVAGDKRQYAGFERMDYTLLYGNATLQVGVASATADEPYVPEGPVVGVGEVEGESPLIFFPNPSENGIFHLSTGSDTRKRYSAFVTDQTGRTLLNTELTFDNNYTLDITVLPPGFYVAIVDDGTTKFTSKLIR